MRRISLRSPMVRVSGRREKLFDSTPGNKLKPRSSFKLPSGDLFLTLVLIVSYLLTRATYENHSDSEISKKIVSFVNKETGMKFKIPSDLKMFKMNAHYKRADKKISDVIFICLLAFFVFKLNWNNTDRFTTEHKLAWGSSVVIVPLIVNLFLEHKDKHKIHPEQVSSMEELKKSNRQTQGFLSIALLLTLAVGLKLAHRIFVCKGGMTKPVLIQLIIIGTTVGLHFLANKDRKENFGSGREDSLSEYFEELFKNKHSKLKNQWKKKDETLKKIKKEDFKTTGEILKDFDKFRLNKFKNDLENRRKRVNEIFKTKESADKHFQTNAQTTIKLAYEVINLEAEADWPKLWKASERNYENMKMWFERGKYEQFVKQGSNPGSGVKLFKKLLMNNDGSMVKLSKDTVPSEDVRKKWIFTIVMGGLFHQFEIDVILNSTEFNTYDKIKGNFKYLFYYKEIFMAYYHKIDYQQAYKFLIKKFEPSQSVDNVFTFYKNKIPRELPMNIYRKLRYTVPFTQVVLLEAYARTGIFEKSEHNLKFYRYENFIGFVKSKFDDFFTRYPKEPTLEDVKKHESVSYTYYCSPYKYSEKEKFIKFYMKPENKSVHEETVIEKDSKQKMNKSWVIAFLLILSFTVCKKDTIDYIIEGSLWGYLIQNIARWDYISPDLM